MRVIVLRIVDIDTVNQNFLAEVFVQGKWLEPKLIHKTQQVCRLVFRILKYKHCCVCVSIDQVQIYSNNKYVNKLATNYRFGL